MPEEIIPVYDDLTRREVYAFRKSCFLVKGRKYTFAVKPPQLKHPSQSVFCQHGFETNPQWNVDKQVESNVGGKKTE